MRQSKGNPSYITPTLGEEAPFDLTHLTNIKITGGLTENRELDKWEWDFRRASDPVQLTNWPLAAAPLHDP